MEHSSSGLSRKRSLDTSHHGQISDPERPNKHPCLAQSSQSDQRQSPQAVRQLEASTSQPREWGEVFLSFSGKQWKFAEKLFEDLQKEHITPVIDRDFLVAGEEISSQIIQAACRCRVAVVVLSESYITSKWSMFELCVLLDGKKSSNPSLKVVPLFFEMSLPELSKRIKNKDVYTSWVNSKRPQTKCDSSSDLNAWFKALETLWEIHGLTYNQDESEEAYRRRVVDCIRRLLLPNLVYEDPFVKGKQRLCQVVEKLFDDTPYRKNGVKIAGLYGVCGSGKTTLCKSLCDFFSHEFKGKVFHVELRGRACIKTFKRALKVLAGAGKTVVKNSVRSIEDRSFLLKKKLRGKKVFLAIDNISDTEESIEEAQLYLNAVCSGYESRILLTARSLGVLGRLIPNPESSSMRVPDLEEEEAIGVLLQPTPVKVSDLRCNDKDVARVCIQKCRFIWYSGNGEKYAAYHPLVLKTFGAYLCDDFKSRADLFFGIDIRNLSNSQIGLLQDIFRVFEESLKDLSPEYFTVFMHMCLYFPHPWMPCNQVLIWLAFVCDRDIEDIEYIIMRLKNKGFIEGERAFYIHDLVMDFAESHADGTGKWVSLKNAVEIPTRLQQASSNERVRFEAMKLYNCEFQSLAGVNYDLLSNVSVLHLEDMAILKTLDLRPMKMLRSLTIVDCPELEEIQGIEGLLTLCYFIIKGCYRDLQFQGVECLMALRHLEVDFVNSTERLGNLPNWDFLECGKLKRLRNLRTVYLSRDCRITGTLDFKGCPNLERIDVWKCDMTGLALDGCSRLTFLKLEMPNLEELPLLGGLTHLKELFLYRMEKLKRLPVLSQLSNLETLHLERMPNLEEFPIRGFTGLSKLKLLHLAEMRKLEELPLLGGLTHLRELFLYRMEKLKRLPVLSQLSNLETLRLEGMPYLEEFPIPSFQCLTNLAYIHLEQMPNLKELPSFTGLSKLEVLHLAEMRHLEKVPCLGGLSDLRELVLCKMEELRVLPSFVELTELRVLSLIELPNLREVPCLNGLTKLCEINLEGMPNLKEKPCLDGLTNLGCYPPYWEKRLVRESPSLAMERRWESSDSSELGSSSSEDGSEPKWESSESGSSSDDNAAVERSP